MDPAVHRHDIGHPKFILWVVKTGKKMWYFVVVTLKSSYVHAHVQGRCSCVRDPLGDKYFFIFQSNTCGGAYTGISVMCIRYCTMG